MYKPLQVSEKMQMVKLMVQYGNVIVSLVHQWKNK